MTVMKPELNLFRAVNMLMVGMGAFLFLTPSVGTAAESPPSPPLVKGGSNSNVQAPTAGTNRGNIPLLIAQTPEYCPDRAGGAPAVAFIETKNFYVFICDLGDRLYYHGVNKGNNQYINIPAYTEEGTGYVADNGSYTYIVTGASVIILRNGRVIQEEQAIR